MNFLTDLANGIWIGITNLPDTFWATLLGASLPLIGVAFTLRQQERMNKREIKQTAYFEGSEYFTERIAALTGMLQYTNGAFGSGVPGNAASGLKLTLIASKKASKAIRELDQAIGQVQLQIATKQWELLPYLKDRDILLTSRNLSSNAATAYLARLESYLQGGDINQPFFQYLQESRNASLVEITKIDSELEKINSIIVPANFKIYKELTSGLKTLQPLIDKAINAARLDIHGSRSKEQIGNSDSVNSQWQQLEKMIDEAEKKLDGIASQNNEIENTGASIGSDFKH